MSVLVADSPPKRTQLGPSLIPARCKRPAERRGRGARTPRARDTIPRPQPGGLFVAQVDLTDVTEVGVEPGTLPDTMAAWVIRQEREGEPVDAFQLEQIEVPQPGAFEVIVRVMAAGVNYNNVWAALGKPVGVWRSHPNEDHHIGGSDASGVVW